MPFAIRTTNSREIPSWIPCCAWLRESIRHNFGETSVFVGIDYLFYQLNTNLIEIQTVTEDAPQSEIKRTFGLLEGDAFNSMGVYHGGSDIAVPE